MQFTLFRIIILEAGEIAEFGGTPRDLLDSKGKFYGMAQDAVVLASNLT